MYEHKTILVSALGEGGVLLSDLMVPSLNVVFAHTEYL